MIADRIALYVAGGGLVVALAISGLQTLRLHHEQLAFAKARAEWNTNVAAAEKLSRETAEKYRAREAELETQRTEAVNAQAAEKSQSAKYRFAAADALGRLRDAIASAPGASCGSTEDSRAAADESNLAARRLLAEGVRVQEELAGGAEDCAADLRAVLRAWPRP